MGTMTSQELYGYLHRHANEGGVGFDVRTADRIIDRINEALKMSYFTYQTHHQQKNAQGEHEPVTDDEKTERMLIYLLKTCYDEHAKNLHPEQMAKLREAIKSRITNQIQKGDFYKALDLPIKEGGAGLNSKTAQDITEEIELILILGFGVVKVNPEDISEEIKDNENQVIKESEDRKKEVEEKLVVDNPINAPDFTGNNQSPVVNPDLDSKKFSLQEMMTREQEKEEVLKSNQNNINE
jgi:hypothetical protein